MSVVDYSLCPGTAKTFYIRDSRRSLWIDLLQSPPSVLPLPVSPSAACGITAPRLPEFVLPALSAGISPPVRVPLARLSRSPCVSLRDGPDQAASLSASALPWSLQAVSCRESLGFLLQFSAIPRFIQALSRASSCCPSYVIDLNPICLTHRLTEPQ